MAQDLRWNWIYLCGKQIQGKKLIFLGQKIWSKINPSIKNVKTSFSFMHALKKIFYFIFFSKKLGPFMDGVQLTQGYRAATGRQFTFYH